MMTSAVPVVFGYLRVPLAWILQPSSQIHARIWNTRPGTCFQSYVAFMRDMRYASIYQYLLHVQL